MEPSVRKEWLETDGRGGFASGTTAGIRTRRYHALLLVATTPPTGRMALVNGFDAWVTTAAGTFPISSQAYAPDVIHPDGVRRIASFEADPWPRWRFRLEDGTALEQEIFVVAGPVGETTSAGASTSASRTARAVVVVAWRLSKPAPGVMLAVRPFLSGRNQHALHRENPNFRFHAAVSDDVVRWQPYPDVPGIVAETNGAYAHRPDWYRNFRYDEERARGLDFVEDLASPGIFTWDLSRGEAVWILRSDRSP
ncbi:MAG: glycogen debranching enzyme N-terminal domain-containing protein, partial [Gammaproteobacteria bacterium]